MLYRYNAILLILKKKGNTDTYNHTDETWRHYAPQKDKYYKIPVIQIDVTRTVKCVETEMGMLPAQGGARGGEDRSYCLVYMEFQSKKTKFQGWGVVIVAQQREYI